jgi:hypothetical protein
VSIFPRFTRRPNRRTVLGLAVASTFLFSATVSVGAASAAKTPPSTPTSAAPHCLTRVIGKSASGELQLSTPVCYATFTTVLLKAEGGVVALSDFIIGTHYDGANYTGASISVQGSDCYGGYINLTGWWANRVSSTDSMCPQVKHYYWPDLGGSYESTYGSGNLSSLNNLSESISYTGW